MIAVTASTDRAGVRQDMPTARPGRFDRLCSMVAGWVSRAVFFGACVALVALWAPSILVIRNVDTWQLVINTATTIVTFLLVALLQNTQSRDNKALQHKLNAIAAGLAELMSAHSDADDTLADDIAALRAAVGLDHREGS